MSEAATPAPDGAKETQTGALKLLVDIGPVIVFVAAYNITKSMDAIGDDAVFWATGLYMIATVAAIIVAKTTQGRLPPMLIITTVVVMIFGALSLGFRLAGSEYADDFAYVKPTIINGLFAVAIIGSLLIKRNVWKIFFGSVFTLPDRVWDILAWRWSIWFIFLGVLNIVLAYPPENAFWLRWTGMDAESFWANFKVVGVLPLTFAFAMANLPITLKHAGSEEMDRADATPEAAERS